MVHVCLSLMTKSAHLPQARHLLLHLQHLGLHSGKSTTVVVGAEIDSQRLVTFYMINYYIKYVELIDTVFLVLKKKPLGRWINIQTSAFAPLPDSKRSSTSSTTLRPPSCASPSSRVRRRW